MSVPIVQVDAFTDRAFRGNPAAVCILTSPRDAGWMQSVAGEMNLSETAFLLAAEEGYRLRWFTPAVEVDLCGHATLASAHVLWEDGHLRGDEPAVFSTRSGRLAATRRAGWIEMDFPADPLEPLSPPEGLAAALGTSAVRYCGRGLYLFVEVESEAELRSLKPNFGAVKGLHPVGVIVTAGAESEGYDFVSRFFGPAVGIDEDPVTGSAHCSLGPYWAERLGRKEVTGYQASPRGGVVRVRPAGERVLLGGRAVTVLRGELV